VNNYRYASDEDILECTPTLSTAFHTLFPGRSSISRCIALVETPADKLPNNTSSFLYCIRRRNVNTLFLASLDSSSILFEYLGEVESW
jgi:hypothetical protein